MRHGLPRLPASQREQWTPQQLALDRLAAYSVKKGCYPGQEIVARTHFLGKAKRSLQCFSAGGRRGIGSCTCLSAIASASPAESGLAMYMCAVAGLASAARLGICCAPAWLERA